MKHVKWVNDKPTILQFFGGVCWHRRDERRQTDI